MAMNYEFERHIQATTGPEGKNLLTKMRQKYMEAAVRGIVPVLSREGILSEPLESQAVSSSNISQPVAEAELKSISERRKPFEELGIPQELADYRPSQDKAPVLAIDENLQRFLGKTLADYKATKNFPDSPKTKDLLKKLDKYDEDARELFGISLIDYFFVIHLRGKNFRSISKPFNISPNTVMFMFDDLRLPRRNNKGQLSVIRQSSQ